MIIIRKREMCVDPILLIHSMEMGLTSINTCFFRFKLKLMPSFNSNTLEYLKWEHCLVCYFSCFNIKGTTYMNEERKGKKINTTTWLNWRTRKRRWVSSKPVITVKSAVFVPRTKLNESGSDGQRLLKSTI